MFLKPVMTLASKDKIELFYKIAQRLKYGVALTAPKVARADSRAAGIF
jgi:hypothetical protein